ncbi:hypothetical protein DFW101_0670 [Solidesulfovibrio carbinoliphilus subsp. oakridgensis]|uniref:DUF3431 domain-containing protein n=1 Tax=Solidesulfovibrio carbinoliphilus subsp. oakridgensis TaxID=694327 RepID=G7QE31_9BACT|nr:DUF3431 domain-containing protein [Solidesulfovibrio carbinoliphilus]EHJ46687.1 hypothetical protein DFW101_0670 [Solidesulfovibrio carbinoliphilus subsp. oakridgensis]
MTGPGVEVVVARYREDVAWTAALGLPVVVYDKSGEPGEHALPNIGRESHTYLSHIVRLYPDFPDFTVFVQAAPFPHMPPGATPVSFAARILQNARMGLKFSGFACFKLKCDRLGRPHQMADPALHGHRPGFGRDIPVGAVYETLFAGPAPEAFLVTAPAGMFFVARDRILARPLAFYKKALELVVADADDAANTGHAFERLWPLIFNGDLRLNRSEGT